MIEVVGRDGELESIAGFLDSASTEPRALVVAGEPGIGKTTLWLAAIGQARERGFRVLTARPAAAESGMAYASLADLLAGVEESTLACLPTPQRLALDGALLRAAADETALGPRAIAAGFLSAITELAATSPVLIAIDDLQWLDSSTAEIIAFATRRLSGPVGVLATVRTGDNAPAATRLEPPDPDALQRIAVAPLSLGALRALICERLGRLPPRPAMVRLHEISGGNPLYALELARTIHDGLPHAAALPPTLAELVNARIAALAPDAQQMLLAAAALAEPTVEVVARAVGADMTHIGAMLGDAEAAGVIDIDGHRLRFSHPLLARGVYTRAAPAQRRAMHARLAELVEQPEPRARHLALGTTHADPDTLTALDIAAGIARQRGAPAAAAELLDLAINLGGDTPERGIHSAAMHFDSGDPARARILLEDTISGLTPSVIRAEALHLLAVVRMYDDNLAEAEQLIENALRESAENHELRTRALVMLSFARLNAGQLDAAILVADNAVDHAERFDHPDLLGQALAVREIVRFMRGDGLDAQALRRALALADPQAHVPLPLQPSVANTVLKGWTGHLTEAADELRTIRQRCIELGEEGELPFVALHSVMVEIWRGNYGDAGVLADDAIERAAQLGGDFPRFIGYAMRGTVTAYTGPVDRARAELAEACAAASRCASVLMAEWPLAMLGFLEVSLGNYEAALNSLHPLLEKLDAAPRATEVIPTPFLPDAVDSLIHVGRLADAERYVDLLEANGRRVDRPWMLALGARCRAMLLAAHGDLDAAADAAQRAIAEHARLPMPFERARTQLLVGQLQRRQRQKRSAATTLVEALDEFEKLGAPLWADRVHAEMGRAYAGTTRSGGLSPSERRVAEMAAAGMTNRDIAADLFISPRTVETNLASAYRKLGIRRRAELSQAISRLDG